MEKDRERIFELLADQILFGLTEAETAELETLKNRFSEFKDDDSFEMAAATVNLINLEIEESLPAHLQTKLEAQAQEFFGAPQKSRQLTAIENNQTENSSVNETAAKIYEIPPRRPIWQWLGWATAAACLVIAISLWLARSKPPEIAEQQTPAQTPETAKSPEVAQIPANVKTPESTENPEIVKTPAAEKIPETAKIPRSSVTPEGAKTPDLAKAAQSVKTPAPELTAAQKREQWMATAPDVIQTNWTAAKGDKNVSGDVVWSNAQQKGFVRLRNLPALDASKETYQLWIFDNERHEKTPVSGGIFTVSSAGEIIVPVDTALKIGKAKQFAVTKEKAGGVVVSKPDRVVAIAKV